MNNQIVADFRQLLEQLSDSGLDEAFENCSKVPDQYAKQPNFKESIDTLRLCRNIIGSDQGIEKFEQLARPIQEEFKKALTQLCEFVSDLKAAGTERIPAFVFAVGKFEALLLVHDLFRDFLVQRFKNFQQRIDEGENKVNALTVENETFLNKLKITREEIDKLLERSVGTSLFHTFEERRKILSSSRTAWQKGLFFLLVVAMALTCWLFADVGCAGTLGNLIILKLTFAVPLIYAVRFCSLQHSRERKLEEEYAFKSNISLSLEAYRGLVEKIVSNPEAAKNRRYTSFVVNSISKIFTSPTAKVFNDEPSLDLPVDRKTLKLWIAFFNSIKRT